MRLYLVRHAIAAERNGSTLDDASRSLTQEGVEKMQQHVRGLAALGVQLDEVWTSPLIRAVQTAEILATGFGGRIAVKTVAALQPDGDFEALRSLAGDSKVGSLALVGHEPYLGEFTGYLLGGSRSLDIRFKKGGVAHLAVSDWRPPMCAELCWLLTPKQLRLMA